MEFRSGKAINFSQKLSILKVILLNVVFLFIN